MRHDVADYIDFFNNMRLYQKLEMLTLSAAEEKFATGKNVQYLFRKFVNWNEENQILRTKVSQKWRSAKVEYLTRLDDYKVKWHSYTEEYISSLGIFADAIISIMAALAKQERIRISERTKAGLERIRKAGKALGRPQTADIEKVRMLREQGLSLSAIARECGISKTRVHQIINS